MQLVLSRCLVMDPFVSHPIHGLWNLQIPLYYTHNVDLLTFYPKYTELVFYSMETKRLYLQPRLTLQAVARLLSVHPHHVSQVINEKLNQNFFDFVNAYRVNHVKKILVEKNLKRYTISGLGREAGFNSRAAFYNAFKKLTNMSPKEYLAQKSAGNRSH